VYDSASEEAVARAFDTLRLEKILRSYFAHPVVGGYDIDFLVQLGSEAPGTGRIVLIEYDGLGLSRRSCLSERRTRLGEISRYGIETRWLTHSDDESVRDVILNYTPPHFLWVVTTCPECGGERSRYVIDREERHLDDKKIERSAVCSTCSP
jgi:hypothetical protein